MGISEKIQKRVQWIGGNALLQLLPLIEQFLISFWVVWKQSKMVWGEVVGYLIVINTLVMFVNWGQNTYLIKAYSVPQADIARIWQDCFVTRIVLLILSIFVLFYLFRTDGEVFIWLLGWMMATFFFRSFDSIHLYVRQFKIPVFIEFFCLFFLLFYLWFYAEMLTALVVVKLYILMSGIKVVGYILLYQKTLFQHLKGSFNLGYFKEAFPFFAPAMIGFVQSRMDLYGVAFYLSKKDLGEYQIFFQILMLFVLGSRVIIGPFLKNIYRMQLSALLSLNHTLFLAAIIAIAPALCLIYFLLPFVYGISYSGMIYVVAYLMLIPFFGYIVLTHILIKYNQEMQMVWAFLFGAMMNLCCNFLLIPSYGILGAILSGAIVQWLLLLIFLFLTSKLKDIKSEVHN